MANHKSAKKRILISKERRETNRYYGKTMRNALKKFRANKNLDEITSGMPSMVSMIDKLAKKNIIHKNKAGNLKSAIMKKQNTMKVATAK